MGFVIKMMVEIEVDGVKHIAKVEKKGPASGDVHRQLRHDYFVIDYDGIFKGNPTVKQIFQF